MTLAAILMALAWLGAGWLWTPDGDTTTLHERYAAPPSRFVQVLGARLHVRDSGPQDAPALLLLHGFGSSLHTWDAWAEGLQTRYRVLRIDLPGAGLTGVDPSADYSDARAMKLIEALLDERGVAQATLVGHSMGGRLAWRFAAERPDRVERLVLIAPDGFASPGFEYGKPPEVGVAVQAMRWVLPRAMVQKGLQPAYADPALLSEETVTRYHELLLAPGVRGALIRRMQQLVLQEPTPWLARIHVPTLLLWGQQDALIPPAHAQDYLRVMRHARLVVLPGVGHLPHEEAPAASLPALLEFLSSTNRR